MKPASAPVKMAGARIGSVMLRNTAKGPDAADPANLLERGVELADRGA